MSSMSIWGSIPLESAGPHEIVDADGLHRGKFKSRSAATRALNHMRKKPSPSLKGDPKTFTVRPFRED